MEMRVLSLLPSAIAVMIAVASWGANGSGDEAGALLAFKAELAGRGSGVLPSWNGSTGLCGWEGVGCSRGRVVSLSLPSYGLTGALSPAIGNLTGLQTLNLSSNWFQGEVPASIGRLVYLQTLDLSYNAFSGTLPANLSSCVSLLFLRLSSNQLRGHIPVELGDKLTSLQKLSLANNSLTGAIPGSLANLSSLYFLDLTTNQLEGPIPAELGSMGGLQVLELFENKLSGVLPHSLYNLSLLKNFQVEFNMLSGTIPADIGDRFPSIEILSFSGNIFSGAIPSSLSNLSALTKLGLSGNSFSGYVPPALGKLQGLTDLYLNGNRLEANDRQGWEFITSLTNCSQLQHLVLGNNSFSGELPSSISNLSTTLQTLYLGDNRISGAIPSNIGNLVGLKALEMANSSLSGAIPESIGRLENLVELGLYSTTLSGLIPPSLGNLTQLNRLYAYYGNLEGPIPTSLGNLKNLFVLDLSTNRLNGSIPREVLKLPQLSFYLDLSYNSLSGPLPTEIGRLANLNQLILSGNQLSGTIPDSIGNCISLERLLLDQNSFEGSIPQSLKNLKGLALLNLTMNKLSGSIPDALASIGNLQQLFLAHNNLSGRIPTVLQNLTLLSKLDLSFNDLLGEVPKGGVFSNATHLSIDGNDELCGGTPQLHLAPCSTPAVEKNNRQLSKSLMVTLTSISTLLFLVLVVALIQLIRKKLRKKQASQFIPTVIDEQYERVSYQALASGTNGFSEANLLGQGSYGAVYKCTLHDQGTTTAVKVFNIRQSGSTRSFVAECEALRRVRHRCLIKIITCCSSIDPQGQEFKALVFEFMHNGSLNDWLHPASKTHTVSNTLSLAQRLDIAVDIMDALDYLHNQCQPPLIHCDLKPSNILLAEDMSARVGDFGISKILPDNTSKTLLNSISFTGLRGSIGYIAPEYGEGCPVSTLGDVYSLGILLLEMFTGRSPTDDMFTDSLDLHKFAKAALPSRALEIADPAIWLHEDAKEKDPAIATMVRSRSEDCLVSVIGLGVSCSKQKPRERMQMRDAAVEIRAIRDAYLMVANSLDGDLGEKSKTPLAVF
ncbi:probable LRR receptor-like serine/threonine-protein kinase At3g47570 [Phragmites australis]|uniref:probable LRR receptor-like serine/threonine-protein kinase At3g47570 n=1 Tax=Phragmites australis TaxID=29695 RepID=UPI002D76F001|nr:probable LRR receptor-like serine/threonine-protein kinase At3g47570 [Phragmites australis]